MKVIREGALPVRWSQELECTGYGNLPSRGCNAILLVEIDDVFETGKHLGRSIDEMFVSFQCPICGVLTDVKDAPFSIREAARKSPRRR